MTELQNGGNVFEYIRSLNIDFVTWCPKEIQRTCVWCCNL